MNKKLFNDYQKLETQIKQLTEKKEVMREAILNEMGKAEVDKVQADYGTFSIVRLPSYSFSKEVKTKIDETKKKIDVFNDKIKLLKEKAIKDGKAKISYSESLRFQAVKPAETE